MLVCVKAEALTTHRNKLAQPFSPHKIHRTPLDNACHFWQVNYLACMWATTAAFTIYTSTCYHF